MTVLAIDQGTTSTRALLVDTAGRTRIVASLPPECFAAFDRMMQAAFVLGMATRD